MGRWKWSCALQNGISTFSLYACSALSLSLSLSLSLLRALRLCSWDAPSELQLMTALQRVCCGVITVCRGARRGSRDRAGRRGWWRGGACRAAGAAARPGQARVAYADQDSNQVPSSACADMISYWPAEHARSNACGYVY
jgi:hypothetical protein|eukprot:COSAG01_NODE_1954_length_8817_cov_18.303166_7_plen_140_part_00